MSWVRPFWLLQPEQAMAMFCGSCGPLKFDVSGSAAFCSNQLCGTMCSMVAAVMG
jgi:hypothetical protein